MSNDDWKWRSERLYRHQRKPERHNEASPSISTKETLSATTWKQRYFQITNIEKFTDKEKDKHEARNEAMYFLLSRNHKFYIFFSHAT